MKFTSTRKFRLRIRRVVLAFVPGHPTVVPKRLQQHQKFVTAVRRGIIIPYKEVKKPTENAKDGKPTKVKEVEKPKEPDKAEKVVKPTKSEEPEKTKKAKEPETKTQDPEPEKKTGKTRKKNKKSTEK